MEQIIQSAREKEKRYNTFMASLQGIDLEKETQSTSFDEVKMRAEAKIRGISEEEYEFNSVGIAIETI